MTAHQQARRIVHRTTGHAQGPITRLMSPGDLGEALKPFVFLDIVTGVDLRDVPFGLHPHSGIATVTVFSEGDARFDDGEGKRGTIGYGGVEWMRAGRGVWHGRELGAGESNIVRGFQLWLSLPPELELAPADSQYLEASCIPVAGPARLIVGRYADEQSPVRAPAGINYLLVTLKPGESWRYDTPPNHTAGFLAVSHGQLTLDAPVGAGELAVLDRSHRAIDIRSTGTENAVFVVGTAEPHRYPLHMGSHSVHTSPEGLAAGGNHILDLRRKLIARERQRTADGPVPVLR